MAALDSVELLMDLEEEFGITIGDAEAGQLVAVEDLHTLITRKLSEDGRTDAEIEACDLRTRVSQILVANYAIDPAKIHPGARIVKDLGIN